MCNDRMSGCFDYSLGHKLLITFALKSRLQAYTGKFVTLIKADMYILMST